MFTPRFARVDFPRAGMAANGGILPRYPADHAAWIWHPDRLTETAFLRFTLEVHCAREESIELQVSADQRFQLAIDGQEFAYGPDRSDVAHWSVHTYCGTLAAGRHTLTALVWWIASPELGCPTPGSAVTPPMAQSSHRGGFLLAASGAHASRFNTGSAPWLVEDLTPAVTLEKVPFSVYHDIGPSFVIDAAQWQKPGPATAPFVVRPPVVAGNPTGVARAGWKLETTPLPEQTRDLFQGGRLREVRSGDLDRKDWQYLLADNRPWEIPVQTSLTLLWDLEDYLCGYPHLQTRGGDGASLSFEWAEALYETSDASQSITDTTPKGHRDETKGKRFFGFGDRFLCAGNLRFPAFWWRSGRYIEIRITTADHPLVIERLGILTTRYPLEIESSFTSDDDSLSAIAGMATTTMQQGAHELFCDSPYYEQMAYVGDNVTESLVSYCMTRDARLPRRAIELFDWSRSITGLVAERWPSTSYQGSTTYAMLWPSMVRNFAWWRNEPDFIRECLRGVRRLVEELIAYQRDDGLLGILPGWSFVDWVSEWKDGCPPGHQDADSSIIQMHWLLCLRCAAHLEEHFGDPELLQRLRRLETEARAAVITHYQCAESGLYYDDAREHFSEHANVLAALLELSPNPDPDWPEKLSQRPHARCTVYFSHYLFEAFGRMQRPDLLFTRLEMWRHFLDYGLHTIPEQPEPTRSDCHAWGAHPLYHIHATVAGIQPASPGFRSVQVRPMFGKLKFLKGILPHPDGKIHYDFQVGSESIQYEICLPENIDGTLEILGTSAILTPGMNFSSIPMMGKCDFNGDQL